MKRVIFALIVLACFDSPSPAMWSRLPLDQLVQDCDLIVVGTLEDPFEYSRDGVDYGEGTIVIDEVIWGAAHPSESITLKWKNRSEIICPRVEHRWSQGKLAIWLLTVHEAGVVRADYPGRFVDLSKRREVERILATRNVCLRLTDYLFVDKEPVIALLVFRNPTDTTTEFPGVEFRDGVLVMHPDVSLAVYSGGGDEPTIETPLPNRVLISEAIEPIRVLPGEEARINVDIGKLFDLAVEENYEVRFGVKGYGQVNEDVFYVKARAKQEVLPAANPMSQQTTTRNTSIDLIASSAVSVLGAVLALLYRQRRSNR